MDELDFIPIDELKKFKKEQLDKFKHFRYDIEQVTEKSEIAQKEESNTTEIIVLMLLSIIAILIVLGLVRNFYVRHNYESDLDRAPIIEAAAEVPDTFQAGQK
uniref:Uncharacterized protein n=1 Tax=Caenorhabditis japonica TaxID=281687 RepID=A0A8R1DV13_CAEJA